MYDVKKGFEIAKEYYARYGVDVEAALKIADETPISMHCWQGDDVGGTEIRGQVSHRWYSDNR